MFNLKNIIVSSQCQQNQKTLDSILQFGQRKKRVLNPRWFPSGQCQKFLSFTKIEKQKITFFRKNIANFLTLLFQDDWNE
jgi:hypothetical protein